MSALALDDDLAVQRTQFDLAKVSASPVNFLGDQSRALQASAGSALRNVFASVDADRRRSGIEIGLEHGKAVLEPTSRLVLGIASLGESPRRELDNLAARIAPNNG